MNKTIAQHKRWKDDPTKGEVFTAEELVREMLDKIPMSVWENPMSTFLDPCMGKGTFLIDILRRLTTIYGYSKEDAVSRIYGYDVRVKYIHYLKRGGFVNVFHKDFLKQDSEMKFDVVIGNPPYQENDGKGKSKGGGRGGDKNLYSKFISKGHEHLTNYGYLALLTPPAIFSPKNKNRDILLSKKNYLSFVKFFEENPFPNVSTNVCFFILQKNVEQKPTKFIISNSSFIEVLISPDDILPSKINQISISIFDKVFRNILPKITLYRDCKLHTQNTEKFSNLYDENNFPYPIYCGSKLKYVSELPNNIHDHKIVISRSGYYKPIIDLGFAGTSETNFFVKSDDTESLYRVMSHPLYKFVVEMSKFNGYIHQDVLKSLPLSNGNNDLYEFFQISEDEKQYIIDYVR